MIRTLALLLVAVSSYAAPVTRPRPHQPPTPPPDFCHEAPIPLIGDEESAAPAYVLVEVDAAAECHKQVQSWSVVRCYWSICDDSPFTVRRDGNGVTVEALPGYTVVTAYAADGSVGTYGFVR